MIHRPNLAALREATRLTRSGRLQEATALLQRSLQPAHAATPPPARDAAVDDADVIDVESREVDTTDAPRAAAVAAPTARTARPTAPPSRDAPTARSNRADAARPRPTRSAAVRDLLRRVGFGAPGAAAASGTTSADASGELGPGRFIDGEFANGAGRRAYKLYIPAGDLRAPRPLIVMLHGCHQSPEDFALGTRMNLQAQAHGCLVLYPAQSQDANPAGCWNWFKREDQVRDRGEPSILADMTRDVMARYAADSRRIYAAGLSAGGAMAAVLAMTYPDLFAAVAIHSGLTSGAAQDLPSALAAMRGMPPMGARATNNVSRGTSSSASNNASSSTSARPAAHAAPVPTIVFHGDRDRTVHPRNGAQFAAQLDDGQHDARDAARSPAHDTQERGEVPDGHAYTRTLHRDGQGRVLLEYWQVHGGGHAWFGGSGAGSYTDPRGPDATAQIARFLLSHPA